MIRKNVLLLIDRFKANMSPRPSSAHLALALIINRSKPAQTSIEGKEFAAQNTLLPLIDSEYVSLIQSAIVKHQSEDGSSVMYGVNPGVF